GCGGRQPERARGVSGPEGVRCSSCGTTVTPFRIENGYTVVFDDQRVVGVTVDKQAAQRIAREAARYAALPEESVQHSILTFAPHDLVGIPVRLRPFLGQLG